MFFFRQEPPQTVGSIQTWPTNLSFYTIGSKGPLFMAIFDNFSLFDPFCTIRIELLTKKWVFSDRNLLRQWAQHRHGLTYPSFYTIGSNELLFRAILKKKIPFFDLFCKIQIKVLTKSVFFRQEPPQTVGSTHTWPTNLGFLHNRQ